MAIAPLANPGSMLDRGIAAYLISQGIGLWRWTKNGDCVIFPADALAIKTYPNIGVLSHVSQHDPAPSGIEQFHVILSCKFSLAIAPNQNVNPYASRVSRDNLIGMVMAAMTQSDDGATLDLTARLITQAGRALATTGTEQEQQNNADMVNFTALHVHYLGTLARGEPDEVGADWVEQRGFGISVSPSAIDMS